MIHHMIVNDITSYIDYYKAMIHPDPPEVLGYLNVFMCSDGTWHDRDTLVKTSKRVCAHPTPGSFFAQE